MTSLRVSSAMFSLTLLLITGCGGDPKNRARDAIDDGSLDGSPGGPGLPGANDSGTAPGDAAPDPEGGAPVDMGPIPECVDADGIANGDADGIADGDADGIAGDDTSELSDGDYRASVTASGKGCARSFTLTSNAPLRDGLPDNPRTIVEGERAPVLRTRNTLFDALYALAIEEVGENSVQVISDGAFEDVTCPKGGCFETGRKWNYVWTRDTAYAVDLGLAALDPTRARNSLEHKLSELRAGGGRQIVQDTGTGGSYPVSSDRVVWAIGAYKLLAYLDGAERAAFRDLAYDAIVNTIEQDRKVVFDARDGLYRGEQSFLDWREQSYPAWTARDVVHIGMSKALSTNVGHAAILQVAAWLAKERGEVQAGQRYQGWADAVRKAIVDRLWLEDEQQLSSFITTELDSSATRRFDALGTSLAVLWGVGSEAQRSLAVERYPVLPKGPPVLWPQLQDIPIYHNRGIWPFVTAYLVRAAREVRNDAVVTNGVMSLVRGAALNLSNMENFELVTGKPEHEDGVNSGPVVNSQRQLWSVAAFVSMVHDVLFGIETSQEGFRMRPFLPRALRNGMFKHAQSLVLNRFPYRGKYVAIKLILPPTGGEGGAYQIGQVRLNGKPAPEWITKDMLGETNLLEVDLLAETSPAKSARLVRDASNYRAIFGPRTPSIAVRVAGANLSVDISLDRETPSQVSIHIYRDGRRIATDLPGDTISYTDLEAESGGPTRCYSAELCYVSTGTCSQHASPVCYWGPAEARIQSVSAAAFSHVGGSKGTAGARTYVWGWGDPSHTITAPLSAARSGEHLLQLEYANGAGGFNTGITCALKQVIVRDGSTVVAEGVVMMPHSGAWTDWRRSSFLRVPLVAGKSYTVSVQSSDTAGNMSRFRHFADYRGLGGREPFERVDIAAVYLLSLGGD